MSLPVVREHTDALIARLEALGLTVGDAVAPSDTAPPYVVVYPIPGGRTMGTLAAPDDDAELVYQITCTGASRMQAEWLTDKVSQILLGFDGVPGRRVARVSLDMHGGVQRDDQVTPPVFWSAPRFRVLSTPEVSES